MNMDRILQEEISRISGAAEAAVPAILQGRRGWVSRVISFLSCWVI